MKGALDVHQALLAVDVPHEVVRLDTRISSADELPRALDLTQGCLAVRCYRATRRPDPHRAVDEPRLSAGDAFAAVLVPAGSTPDPEALLTALAAVSVRPALPEEVNTATEFAAGLVSPIGLPAGVELLVDAAIGGTDVVYTAVGEGGLALGIRTRDLLLTTGARVAALTSRPSHVRTLERSVDVVDLVRAEARRSRR